MKAHLPIVLMIALTLGASSAPAWESYEFDLPAQTRESAWRDALASKLHGRTEVPVEGGRVDVLTDKWAIEVDWSHKWHEGLGQALHYADMTHRQGVVALISYATGEDKLREKTVRRFHLVERLCEENGIKLIVLFPTKPRVRTPQELAHGPMDHWLNTRSGTRHNVHCRFYHNTEEGRDCGADEGRPCSLCGG